MDRNALIEAAREAFVARFGYAPQACGVAPGRVELLGNHTDYNEGFVLTIAIDRGIAVAGSPREVPKARIASTQYDSVISFDPAQPDKTPEAAWTHYVKGVVEELNKCGATIGSFDALVTTNVPTGAGVSSSAALLVSTAELLLALYPHILMMNAMELAKLCRRAENNFVGAPVGLLDQFSSVFGQEGKALFLDCRTLEHRTVQLPTTEARILIADSGIKHDLAAGGGYRERRAQCEAAAAWFGVRTGKPIKTLRDVTVDMLSDLGPELDPVLEKRTRHIVYENKRVEMAVAALEAGNLTAFGEVMTNTHESCRRFFENSCEEVDALVDIALGVPGVYGAKLTGGGWGGCAVILHEPDALDTLTARLTEGYATRFPAQIAERLSLLPTVAAQGAEAVRFE